MSTNQLCSNGEGVLPENFMQTVIELETQLECQDPSMAVVQQLNDLYVVAMDYYIQHDLRKLQHFHRKLTSLLTHPKTLKNIQNTTTTEKQDNSYSRSLKCEMSKFNNEGMILVRSMLDGSEMKANNSKRAIIENIENQEALLKQRLLQRAKSKSITAPLRS